MNTSIESTKPSVTAGFAWSDIVKFVVGAVLVGLLTFGAHRVLGSVEEPEADVASEEVDADYFPPAYAFRAIDFDDPFNAY